MSLSRPLLTRSGVYFSQILQYVFRPNLFDRIETGADEIWYGLYCTANIYTVMMSNTIIKSPVGRLAVEWSVLNKLGKRLNP